VVGLARAGLLDGFLTAGYYGGSDPLTALGQRFVPGCAARARNVLLRRHHPEIPRARVSSAWSYDVALQLESRLPADRHRARRGVARWRTRRFDRALARTLRRRRPESLVVFSDVGSEFALPLCRDLGINAVLSMVHGDVREEQSILEREAASDPAFFRI
jgi:hypothetical protein